MKSFVACISLAIILALGAVAFFDAGSRFSHQSGTCKEKRTGRVVVVTALFHGAQLRQYRYDDTNGFARYITAKDSDRWFCETRP